MKIKTIEKFALNLLSPFINVTKNAVINAKNCKGPTMPYPSGSRIFDQLFSEYSRSSGQIFHPHSYQSENATNVQNSRIASALSSSASGTFSAAPTAASAFVDDQEPPCQIVNTTNAQNSSSMASASSSAPTKFSAVRWQRYIHESSAAFLSNYK